MHLQQFIAKMVLFLIYYRFWGHNVPVFHRQLTQNQRW